MFYFYLRRQILWDSYLELSKNQHYEKATSCFNVCPFSFFWQDFKVVRVIDGDTFIIEGGERVRMIGIDAPELKDLYGVESKNQLKALIQNKHVKLIKGVVTANKDYFKRLLRYVYIDSTDINLKMIEDGFASVYLKYPFSKSSEYKTIFDYIKTNKLR